MAAPTIASCTSCAAGQGADREEIPLAVRRAPAHVVTATAIRQREVIPASKISRATAGE